MTGNNPCAQIHKSLNCEDVTVQEKNFCPGQEIWGRRGLRPDGKCIRFRSGLPSNGPLVT
jgi:hypothetical protein